MQVKNKTQNNNQNEIRGDKYFCGNFFPHGMLCRFNIESLLYLLAFLEMYCSSLMFVVLRRIRKRLKVCFNMIEVMLLF